MIAAHRNILNARLPRVGVIRKGSPKGENSPGKDLDYFRLDRADSQIMQQWESVYGQRPSSITGILPYNDPAENLSIYDELWNGKRMLWRGDGERLLLRLEGNEYVRYAEEHGPPQPAAAGELVSGIKVSRISRLRIMLPQMRVAGIFEVMSGSIIDADELWLNLLWIRQMVAQLQGTPVTVFRAARQFNIESKGKMISVTKHMLHMMLDGRRLDDLMLQSSPVMSLADANPIVANSTLAEEEDYWDNEESIEDNQSDGAVVDEEIVLSASATDFVKVTSGLLEISQEAVIERLKAHGYSGIPGAANSRLNAYRLLKEKRK